MQVRDKVTQVRIDGLEMHVVEDSIPVHRETLGRDTGYAIDNIYTRSISYYDLQPKTYYLLLRCKEDAVEFEIRPEIATSILELGTSVQVEICPDDLLHHKIIAHEHTVPEMAGGSEGPHHLKVRWLLTPSTPPPPLRLPSCIPLAFETLVPQHHDAFLISHSLPWLR